MTETNEYPRCDTLEEFQALTGKHVMLVGSYHQVDMRMRQKPPAVYSGHVAIQLRDGNDILLEPGWSSEAIRSAEERARYDGKSVEVTGVAHRNAPEPAEPVAYVMDACLSPVEIIRLSSKESSG